MTVVLANPSASGFTGGSLRTVLNTLGDEARAVWPKDAAGSTLAAAEAGREGETVVAMGGDGMVHHVARGLIGTPGRLAIIPVGTTNVLARLLGVPSDTADAASLVADGVPRAIRTALASYEQLDGEQVERPALFSLGVGWDAEVVAAAETEPYRKARGGVRLYARAAIRQLRREVGRLPDLVVHTSPPVEDDLATAIQVQVQDSYTFAGPLHMRIGPPAEAGFSLAVWRRISGPSVIPLALATQRADGLAGRPEVDVFEATEAEVATEHGVRLQIDGEPLGEVVRLRVSMGPPLEVLVPDPE